jgi:hypothetical protein
MLDYIAIMNFLLNKSLNNLKIIPLRLKSMLLKVTNQFITDKFLQMTVQPSIVGTKIKRTKFFFGYRYMWTRCQLAEPGSYIGAGVRKDVT